MPGRIPTPDEFDKSHPFSVAGGFLVINKEFSPEEVLTALNNADWSDWDDEFVMLPKPLRDMFIYRDFTLEQVKSALGASVEKVAQDIKDYLDYQHGELE